MIKMGQFRVAKLQKRVRAGLRNESAKGKRLGRPCITVDARRRASYGRPGRIGLTSENNSGFLLEKRMPLGSDEEKYPYKASALKPQRISGTASAKLKRPCCWRGGPGCKPFADRAQPRRSKRKKPALAQSTR